MGCISVRLFCRTILSINNQKWKDTISINFVTESNGAAVEFESYGKNVID